MNEHLTPKDRGEGSPERMAQTAKKYQAWIGEGISAAQETGSEIDVLTARLIAHALGRAFGRTSALAGFARTGDGDYEALRDEYLALYTDETAPEMVREWINWFGTHLVYRDRIGSGRQFANEHLPPTLDRILLEASLQVGDESLTVHVPATCDRDAIVALAARLGELGVGDDEAMQAFLTLPDVNAAAENLTDSFTSNYIDTYESLEEATHHLMEIDEWERDITDYARERGFHIDGISPDYETLIERVRDAYDLVEWKTKVHGFYK